MAVSKEVRQRVYLKMDGKCGYCGRGITIKEMQVDHMNPICNKRTNLFEREGIMVDCTHEFENLMPSCRRCNHYKRGNSVEQFRASMKTLHKRLEAHYINKVAVDFGMITILPFDEIFYFEKAKPLQP